MKLVGKQSKGVARKQKRNKYQHGQKQVGKQSHYKETKTLQKKIKSGTLVKT